MLSRVDREVSLNIEFITIKGSSPAPLVVAPYGMGRDSTVPQLLITNQFIKTGVVVTNDFFRLKVSGITQNLMNANQQITILQLLKQIQTVCQDRLIIFHGPNDMESLGMTHDTAGGLERECNCSHPETTTIFTDAEWPIGLARLAQHYLKEKQPKPHTASCGAIVL